jgi:hypothetical protein
MKKAQCPNCSRWLEREDDIVRTLCPCGEMVKFPKLADLSNENTKDDQVILKTVFERGVRSGKEPDAQQIVDEVLNERIKVNLNDLEIKAKQRLKKIVEDEE